MYDEPFVIFTKRRETYDRLRMRLRAKNMIYAYALTHTNGTPFKSLEYLTFLYEFHRQTGDNEQTIQVGVGV